ncbi:probable ATP-dependent RNA helicase DHX40 [Bombina bombina]|uniref:probable ATP-dependent RNA helicase DHX40 n=1 Tax=Bombina bombina TaxID=8345 RepID=UPI00235B18C3|nr:probable ATP-dependent RNA helicase DHX40 [Bombina bombina]XP_053563295.1 probable ATP-dependent RNA helicase DHX40 [Bombina bombina]XP_053563296.1 probable ATP-dependent RNA helicase DHX40 [Bombina bombina]
MEKKDRTHKREYDRSTYFPTLPIHSCKEKLLKAAKDNYFLIVTGDTGSGKTTQLPQYLYKAGFGKHGMIGVTQPRRVATISVAQRVAEEMHCSLGSTVGYQVRFDDCTSEETVIKYMTDGCLLRHTLTDPDLVKYGTIVLDEAHERSLSTDILFGLLRKQFQLKKSSQRKYPLKVIVMSATLEIEKLSEFFDCPVVHIPGKLFPIKEKFFNLISPKDKDSTAYVTETVKVALQTHLNEPAGDILVFLTGQLEIEKACNSLFKKAECIDYQYDVFDSSVKGLLILPMYGSMPTAQQKRIFLPPPEDIRKCILSTNIAATSVTIEGIRYVIDSGFVKQLNHNPRVGLDVLEVVPISKSEAIQRTGRAGRTAPGKCHRIYSEEFWDKCMPDHMIPEIKRTSLTSVILTLKCLGVHDVIRFPYLDHPEEKYILEALKKLYQCDAIDRRGNVTQLGHFIVEFPLPPNLACSVIKAASYGCEDLLLPVAAMLSVEHVFIHSGGSKKPKEDEQQNEDLSRLAGGNNDFATLLYISEQCKYSENPSSWCHKNGVHWRALKSALSVEKQLKEITNRLKEMRNFPREKFDGSKNEMLRRCLCAGYFSNIARRSIGTTFCTMDGHGSTVHIHPSSALCGQEAQLEWILFHSVLVTTRIFVKTVCPIRYEWVKDLLPKLHDIDAYELSSVAREEVTEEEIAKWESKEELKQHTDDIQSKILKTLKRNDDKSISDARARYLQRKQQKSEDPNNQGMEKS